MNGPLDKKTASEPKYSDNSEHDTVKYQLTEQWLDENTFGPAAVDQNSYWTRKRKIEK